MSIRSLNGLSGATNVYLNRDPIQATEPVLADQPTVNDPITISLKGLSGIGASNAGKVIKVNTGGTALEYADDIGSNWTVSGTKIYPTTATHLLVNTTTNTNNRTLKVNGDAEIATQLYLTGTSSTIQLDNNSSSGLYFKNATNQGFKFYADNGDYGSPHLNNETISGWLFKISSTSTIKHRFLNGTTEIYSNGGAPDTTKHYFVKASNTNIGNYIQNDFTNNTFQLRKFTSLIDEYFLQYDITNEVLTIPDKLVLSATTNQLSDGTNNYILPSSSGTLQLTTDPINATTTTLFGTAVSGGNTIKMGNTAGTGQVVNLELYFSASLKLYNTSNVLIGQFTPQSNTCNLSLNSGVISSATWNGTAISYDKGGTGLTSLTANKILQVNATATGYNQVDLPSQYWSLSSGVLTPATSTNHILAQNELRVGSSTYQVYFDYSAGGNEFKFNYADRNTSTEIAINKYNNSFNVFTQYVNTVFESPITVNSIKGENSATNTIKDDGARGWEFQSVNPGRMIALESGSYYPYLGVDSTNSIPFLIHINNISGNAYEINNTNNTLSGLRHEFYGEVVFNSTIRAEGGNLAVRVGSLGDYTALEYEETNNVFYLYNSTSTKYFMEYQANSQTTLFRGNNFTFSSGTANNDCILQIEADTDNNDESANPEIRLRADGGNTGVNMKMDDNDFRIETIYSGQNIVLNPYSGANVDINAGLTSCSDQFDCATSRFRIQRISSLTYFYNPSGTHSASGGGSASFAGSYWSYHDNGSAIYFNLPNAGTGTGSYFGFASGSNQKARIDMTGSGKITGSWTGGWAGTSDKRLKKNIGPIENAVDTLMKINIYQFDKYDIDNYNCIHSDCGENDCLKPFTERLSEKTRFVYGFIAQELCENTPEIGKMCVETNNWGEEEPAYIIDDRPILACAIKTIQTQQEEINTLKQEVNTYKQIIDKLIKAPSFKSFKESLA